MYHIMRALRGFAILVLILCLVCIVTILAGPIVLLTLTLLEYLGSVGWYIAALVGIIFVSYSLGEIDEEETQK